MALDVVSFEKSLDERFEEYRTLFFNEVKPLPASEIENVWCNQIELMIEPSGWQALWKLSRPTCRTHNIQFPTLIFVVVEKVIPDSLSAIVKILAVQDNIHLPDQHEVPLIHLYPTVRQEDKSLLLGHTADCLDQLRYFYNHLWMPWDDEDDDINSHLDWFKIHLEQRLNIFRDMQNGSLNQMEIEYIKLLLGKIAALKERIMDLEEGTIFNDSVFELEEDESRNCELIDLHSELNALKLEVEALENPLTRKVYLLKKIEPISNRRKDLLSEMVFLVWLGGPYDDFMNMLLEVKKYFKEDAFVKPSTLSDAIHEATAGDTILLSPGVHLLDESGKFLKNYTIRGFSVGKQDGACIIACRQQNDALMDWSGSSIQLQDVIIRDDNVWTLGIIRQGVMKLHNCVLEASSRKNTDGLLVLDGGRVELHHCNLIGLRIGIIAHAGASVSLNNCTIRNCKFGIKASEKSHLTMKDCQIAKCENYGIEIQRSKQDDDLPNKTGSLDLLTMFNMFNVTGCSVQSNSKGDVLLSAEDTYSQDLLSSDSTGSGSESENTSSGTIVLS